MDEIKSGVAVAVDQKNQLITNMQTAEYFNYFYSKEFQQDFTPVFLQWGITFDRSRIEAINRSKEYSPVAPIAAVVPKNRLKRSNTTITWEHYGLCHKCC